MRALLILLCLAVSMIQIGAVVPAVAGPADKVTSAPPLTPVNDLSFDATNLQTLTWTYCVNGDYDQNGEVGVSDITPVGLHFGKTMAAADWDTARVADGDGNGEVNASDLTRIGLNFGATVSEFMVLTAPAETGPFVGGAGTVVAFDSVPKPAGGGPRPFEFELASPVPNNWYCVVARDAEGEATEYSNMVQYVPGNLPPVAAITTSSEMSGPPGLTMQYSMADSSDPDGTIVKYELDAEGTGEFIDLGPFSFSFFIYTHPGTYRPVVRVTDDEGATGTSEGDPVTVSLGDMRIDTLDSTPEAGIDICATNTVEGTPVAAYLVYGVPPELMFVRPQTIDANHWLAPQFIDLSADVGYLTIGKDSGGLIIGCQEGLGSINLYYGAADGSTWGLPVTIRSQDSSQYGFNNSMLVIDDTASMAYEDNEHRIIHTAYYASDYWHVTVTPFGAQGANPSICSIGGKPTIVYSNTSGGVDVELFVTQLPGYLWNPWSDPVVLVNGTEVVTNQYSLMETGSNDGLIVYFDRDAQALMSIVTTDYMNLAWADPVTADPDADVEHFFSTYVVNALPCIAYQDAATNELRVIYGRDRKCQSWNEPIVVTSNSAGFDHIVLVQRENYPMIFFHDLDDDNLKAVVFSAP